MGTRTQYFLKGRRIDSKTMVWDNSAKDFFTNVLPRVESVTPNYSHIFWDMSVTYGGTVEYEYIKYRNGNGTITTLINLPSVTCYDHTYQSAIGLAPLPNNLALYNLLAQNKDNPYVEVKLVRHDIRAKETKYNSSLDSLGKASGTNDEIRIVYKNPIIKNASLTRDNSNKQYVLDIDVNYLDKIQVTLTKMNVDGNGNNEISYSYETTSRQSIIKESYLAQGVNKVDIVVWNGVESTTYTKEITHYTPSVSSLVIANQNKLIDDTTTLTWQSTNQTRAEIYNNENLIKTINGSVNIALLNKGTLKVGNNNIKVVVFNQKDDRVNNSEVSAQTTSSITLSRIEPAITEDSFKISSTNIDNRITLKWQSKNQSRFEIYQNSKLITFGKSEKTCTISEGVLSIGKSKIKLIVYYDSGFDTIKLESSIEEIFKHNEPIIYNLEPSNLNIDIDEQVNVTFETNEFCDRWELSASGLFTQGTNERKVSFGRNVFANGINTMTLISYYSPPYDKSIVRTAKKVVTFTGYGTPNLAIIDENTTYSTACPTITWESVNQTAYNIVVTKDGREVVNTGDIISTETSYTFTNVLENNSTYIFKIKYKNNYKWNEYATKEFKTLFNDIIIPNFTLFEADNSVYITVDGIQDKNFKSLSIFRRTEYQTGDGIEIAYNCNVEDTIVDYVCPSNVNVYYKLRVFDTNGGYRDSEIKSIKINLLNYNLTNIEDGNNTYRLDFVKPSFNINTNIVTKMYTGQKAPRVFKGKTNYKTGSFIATLRNEEAMSFINYINNANDCNLFCYRDWKGEKLFAVVTLKSIIPINAFYQEVSFDMTEINFVETKMYTGTGFRKIVYLDGEYSLNGEIDLTGYDDNFRRG